MKINRLMIYFYCFILGLLGFSVLGQYLQLEVFHLPFYFIEIYFIPAILMNISRISDTLQKIRHSTAILTLFILMSMFTNVVSTGQVFEAVIAYRGILYLLFCICFFRQNQNNISINMVFLIALGAVCGEATYVLELSTADVTSSLNVLAIGTLIWIPYIQRKYTVSAIAAALSIFIAINTGFRVGILVVLFTICSMFLYSIINGNQSKGIGSKLKTASFFATLILGVTYFINNLNVVVEKIATMMGMSSFAVFRVTTRLESILSFDVTTSQDTGRLEEFNVLGQRLWNVVPRGLFGFVKGGGEYSYYIDIPPAYLIDIFGSAITLLIMSYYLLQFISQAKINKVDSQVKIVSIWLMPLLGFLVLSNGTFMVNVGQAIITGTLLGYVVRNNNLLTKNQYYEGVDVSLRLHKIQ